MNIVILAAGQGKRMRSSLPKVLHPIAGRPMLAHVIDTARIVSARQPNPRIVVVVGHGAEAVRTAFASERDVVFVLQEPQLGTGHAVMQALPHLADGTHTLVLYGDVPLVSAATLERLLVAAGRGVGLLTVLLDDPHGYGRIVRGDGQVRRIVEEKDASPAERALREVNTGILVAPTHRLRDWLAQLSDNNAQREYYLTDIIAQAVAEGISVNATHPDAVVETLGVNSKSQLAQLERTYQRRLAEALLERGVTLADPAEPMCRSMSAACSKAASCSATAFASVRTMCCAIARSARAPKCSGSVSSRTRRSVRGRDLVRSRACVRPRPWPMRCTLAISSK
jgi:bifunctional UDP-N-acetylglucosamine pyrophosphorylase / glucosamine-1-phosphate N-acetyltransferase